ncbi:MAG: D-alanyl-D-alanine carboxypeptidase family protein [Deltaproteobacteria bacterium]|nr:D-alanyl-D-alanine carboxypeptidase family protein [Deltaproteobacteria bacterium]
MRGTSRALFAILLLGSLAPACAPNAPPPDEARTRSLESQELALSSINCSESTATGYRNGSSFTIRVVTVDGKKVEKATANAYMVMAQAAQNAGLQLRVVSGFRTYAEQQYLYNCYIHCNCNNCNLAARPGYSNHQSGHALDLNTGGFGTSIYNWLTAHGAAYGFSRTVPSESWHWEWWGGGPGGGPCGAQYPNLSVEVRTYPPSGQSADFRPEGSSSGVMDLYAGQEFVTEIIVRNAANAGPTQSGDDVKVGVWFETPYITPVSYRIYTDYPHFDLSHWVISNADSIAANPPKTAPTNGAYRMEHFAPGEGKKIRFVTRANQYSIGQVDHPDVRVWLWHAAGYYGEQTSWGDAVETNHAGHVIRHYKQHDIYSRLRWEFDAPQAPETEGWAKVNGVASLALVPASDMLRVGLGGSDPHIANTTARVNTASYKAVRLRARSPGAAQLSQMFFITDTDGTWNEAKSAKFISPGGNQFTELTVSFADNPKWTGTVTGLRLDPATSGTFDYDIDWMKAIASGTTSGDADHDGFLTGPGPDCDDAVAAVHPGAAEACNGRDDDCDGATDEGVTNACGGCGAVGQEVCNGIDDDCDGETDEGVANACGGCGAEPEEVCNGVDDDCDGLTDEGVSDPCGGCGEIPPEVCNGLDDDCDGLTDEGVANACGGCGAPPKEVCNGLDDDCDGETDENVTNLCGTCGEIAEVCNGLDDDCDGAYDEDFDIGSSCVAGYEGCETPGFWACDTDGGRVCAAADPWAANPEICNGVDDDCDGRTDEGGLCQRCLSGVSGPCTLEWMGGDCTDGTRACVDGVWQRCEPRPECIPTEEEPIAEPPVEADAVGSDAEEPDTGVGVADDAIAGRQDVVVRVDSVRTARPANTGCGGGATDGPAWLLLGAALVGVATRRRRLRG